MGGSSTSAGAASGGAESGGGGGGGWTGASRGGPPARKSRRPTSSSSSLVRRRSHRSRLRLRLRRRWSEPCRRWSDPPYRRSHFRRPRSSCCLWLEPYLDIGGGGGWEAVASSARALAPLAQPNTPLRRAGSFPSLKFEANAKSKSDGSPALVFRSTCVTPGRQKAQTLHGSARGVGRRCGHIHHARHALVLAPLA